MGDSWYFPGISFSMSAFSQSWASGEALTLIEHITVPKTLRKINVLNTFQYSCSWPQHRQACSLKPLILQPAQVRYAIRPFVELFVSAHWEFMRINIFSTMMDYLPTIHFKISSLKSLHLHHYYTYHTPWNWITGISMIVRWHWVSHYYSIGPKWFHYSDLQSIPEKVASASCGNMNSQIPRPIE